MSGVLSYLGWSYGFECIQRRKSRSVTYKSYPILMRVFWKSMSTKFETIIYSVDFLWLFNWRNKQCDYYDHLLKKFSCHRLLVHPKSTSKFWDFILQNQGLDFFFLNEEFIGSWCRKTGSTSWLSQDGMKWRSLRWKTPLKHWLDFRVIRDKKIGMRLLYSTLNDKDYCDWQIFSFNFNSFSSIKIQKLSCLLCRSAPRFTFFSFLNVSTCQNGK